MADESAQSAADDDTVKRRNTKELLRFFSVDSDINMASNLVDFDSKYNFYSKDFILKIAQLINGIICCALYGAGVTVMTDSTRFMCFPNVVFGSYIIITAVIIISYMLGQIMPDVLIRVFLSIGMILYFINATVTTTIWCSKQLAKHEVGEGCLIGQAVVSYLNSVLYGLDLFYNIKRAVTSDV